MLFCCLWHNAETSCQVVINISSSSPYYQLTTSDKRQNFKTCGWTVVRRRRIDVLASRSVNSSSEARYRLRIAISPPAFDAAITIVPSEYCYRKTRMAWLPDGEKISKISIHFDRMYERDRHTQTHTAWWHRPHLHGIARQKLNCF